MLSRRDFIKTITKSTLGAFILSTFPKLASATNNDSIKYIRQIITKYSINSRTIMWESATLYKNSTLVLENTFSKLAKTYSPIISSIYENNKITYIYTVYLKDLTEETSYKYRIELNTPSPWYILQTPKKNAPFEAIIFADTQCSDDYATWKKCAQMAISQHPNAEFFINMGDLVDNGEASWQWEQWKEGADLLWRNIPLVPIMGNHETYDLKWKCRIPQAYLSFFNVPDNDIPDFKNYFYSYDFGVVHFVVLNTQWSELLQFKPTLLKEQIRWLEKDIAKNTNKWIIVLMHKDVIYYANPNVLRAKAYPNKNKIGKPVEDFSSLPENTTNEDIDEVGKLLMPYFDKLNVDVVLTAHQHIYRRHDHIFNFKPAKHGPIYICTGNSGNLYFQEGFTRRFDKVYMPQPEKTNFITLNASTDKLIFRSYLLSGQLIDECTIQKDL